MKHQEDEAFINSIVYQRISKAESELRAQSEANPTLVLAASLLAGVAIGYLGLKKIVKIGFWLRANEIIS